MRFAFVCCAFILAAFAARADIAPEPDRGPPMATVAGLDFAVQPVQVEFGPQNGPHYYKTLQAVVLTGCTDGHPNCRIAKSKRLIGMEVLSVDDASLQPEHGMVQQIIDAFSRSKRTVILELFARGSQSEPVKVAFERS
ncbi:MAG: hypothetical protein WCA81_02695 [Rhizomicrobium sp.]|jgi:hypothetical protein